jgi:hypothetical protein
MKQRTSFTAQNLRGQSPVPSEINLDPEWGEQFDHANGVTFKLPGGRFAYLFLDKHLSSSKPHEVVHFLRTESTAGHVINCENQEWILKFEPTTEGKFGLIVYTKAGKAYIAGEGKVGKSGKWRAAFKTLYPGIRNTKRCKVSGGIRGGTGQKTEVQVGVTCS